MLNIFLGILLVIFSVIFFSVGFFRFKIFWIVTFIYAILFLIIADGLDVIKIGICIILPIVYTIMSIIAWVELFTTKKSIDNPCLKGFTCNNAGCPNCTSSPNVSGSLEVNGDSQPYETIGNGLEMTSSDPRVPDDVLHHQSGIMERTLHESLSSGAANSKEA
jgi:hypothetical protein